MFGAIFRSARRHCRAVRLRLFTHSLQTLLARLRPTGFVQTP